MNDSSNQLRLLVTGPALCGLLLAGMTIDNRNYRTEVDYEDFHARAAAAIRRIPLSVGTWSGRDEPLSKDELALLRPNAYRCIAYTDTRLAENPDEASPRVLLRVTQCKRAGLMEGHYPPNAYLAQGFTQVGGRGNRRTWTVGRQRIEGTEYFFERQADSRADERAGRTCVYNFMVLPQQGVRPDIQSVSASAEDYQQRYYGAAQFQLVFGGRLARATPDAREERDRAFAELIGPCAGVIATLCDGVNSHE